MANKTYYLVQEQRVEVDEIVGYRPVVLMRAEGATTLLPHAAAIVAEMRGPGWLWIWEDEIGGCLKPYAYCGLTAGGGVPPPSVSLSGMAEAIDHFLRVTVPGLDLVVEAQGAGEPLEDPSWKQGPFAVDPTTACGG